MAENPLAGTINEIGIPPPLPSLGGYEVADFTTTLTADSIGQKLLISVGAAAGLFDLYSNPRDSGAAPDLNKDYNSKPSK